MSNIRTIQEIYQAFGRGDVPWILERLSADVDWEYSGAVEGVPWLQNRVGRSAAAGFFEALGGLQMDQFVPKDFLEVNGVVVVLLDVAFVVKATGKRVVEQDEIHVWRFDALGKIARFRHGANTHVHFMACRAGGS